MITNKFFVAICFLLLSSFSATSQHKINGNVLPATALHPYGRTLFTNDKKLELISSAVHFGFSFYGKECQIFASIPDVNAHNYLQYVLDGKYQKRIRINGNSDQPTILNVSSEGKHTVWIYKATEATTGPIFIDKVVAKNIRSLPNPALPLIEFIGNSITCGACADASEVPCGTGVYHDQHNAYYAYGPRVARALNVNFILSSVSGIGIYRNWNSNGPTMPQVYENAELNEQNSHRWNFKLYDPKIVSIALGTNDYSSGDGKKVRLPFDSAIFVSGYIKFVRLVKSKYPKAKIALLSSPMINGDRRIILQNCLTAVKINIDKLYSGDKPVGLFFFKPMEARGCSGHPSVEDHAILANELIPFFKKLLQQNL
jgi:hypothetical protein